MKCFLFYYNLSPQHVSAPTGHPQVEHNISLSFHGAINNTADPLFCDCLYMWCELFYTYFTVFFIMLQLELKLT
jgi:hypothetical protein